MEITMNLDQRLDELGFGKPGDDGVDKNTRLKRRDDGIWLAVSWWCETDSRWQQHKRWLEHNGYDVDGLKTGHWLINKLVGFSYDETWVLDDEADVEAIIVYLNYKPISSNEAIAVGTSTRKTVKSLNELDKSHGGTGNRFRVPDL